MSEFEERKKKKKALREMFDDPEIIQSKSLDELVEMVQEIRAETSQDFQPWMILDWIVVLARAVKENVPQDICPQCSHLWNEHQEPVHNPDPDSYYDRRCGCCVRMAAVKELNDRGTKTSEVG